MTFTKICMLRLLFNIHVIVINVIDEKQCDQNRQQAQADQRCVQNIERF